MPLHEAVSRALSLAPDPALRSRLRYHVAMPAFDLKRRRLIFLILASVILGSNFCLINVPNQLNGHGAQIPEFPLLIDVAVTLPLLYWWLFKPSMTAFLKRCIGLFALGALFGSFALPAPAKHIWLRIESLQVLAGNGLLGIELIVAAWFMASLFLATRGTGFVDEVRDAEVTKRFGTSVFGQLMQLESRVWYYGLFMRAPDQLKFRGDQHFYYARHEGNASNQLGFIGVILLEIPLLHLVLHFSWSPLAALTVSGLTAYSLLYLVAEYRATLCRPVSLTDEAIIVRCGAIASDLQVPLAAIAGIEPQNAPVPRQAGVRRLRQTSAPNVRIKLRDNTQLPNWRGEPRETRVVFLCVDDRAAFIEQVQLRRQNLES
jgi:hypothetical protein